MPDRILSPIAVEVVAFTGVNWRPGEDGERGIYVAAAPRGDAEQFAGAAIYLAGALGEGVCWERRGTLSSPSSMGFVRGWETGALPDHIPGSDGTGYSIEVEMISGELESYASVTEAACSRANLARVGDEVLRFSTATLTDDGVSYAVSNFSRALFGTNSASHDASERFTVLDDNTAYVPLSSVLVGRDVYVKVVPAGFTVDDVEAVSVDVPDVPDIVWDTTDDVGMIGSGQNVLYRPSVQRLRVVDTGDGVELRWDDIEHPSLSHYEIRVGDQWGGAPVIERTSEQRLVIPRVVTTARTYRIRGYFNGGLFSDVEATVSVTPAVPDAETEAVATTDVPPEISGHSNTELNADDYIILSDGFLSGTYTATEVDAGSVATYEWIAFVDSHHQYLTAVDDWDFPLGSLESRRWTSAGPEPVRGSHGGDTGVTVEDYPPPEDWGAGWTTLGRTGSSSDFTRLLVEVRFDTDGLGTWTSWEEYEPQRRTAQKCQVRVTLSRVSEDWQRYVTAIRVEARS